MSREIIDDKVISKVFLELQRILRKDIDPHSGRLWSYVYETGIERLRALAEESYRASLWRNMLDPTVFPSVIQLEKDVVDFVARLFNAPDGYVGNFTSGGTESNFLALLAARERFYEKAGRSSVPKVVAPSTIHPSVAKAAWILGVKLEVSKVNENYVADVEDLVSRVDNNTAAVFLSAPNYPFGTFDPVKEVAEHIENKENVWLHVDSCLGFSVPFARRLGKDIPVTDFRIERVDSISVDLHKLAYAPRGASTIVHRDRAHRKYHLFVYSRWAGYPLVNQIAMSSRTSGPLAAAWSLLKALGEDGYLELTRMAYEARDMLVYAMTRAGFDLEGNPPYLVMAFSHSEIDLVEFAKEMGKRGWHIQVQPGSRRLGFPMTVHFTVTPVHKMTVNSFIRELDEVVEGLRGKVTEKDPLLELLSSMKSEEIGKAVQLIVEALGGEGLEGADLSFISRYIYELDPDVVEVLFREVANLLL